MTAVSNVLALNDSRAQRAEHTGGKGANLAALSRAGFPVPEGLVVTTNAYSTFIEQSGLQHRIATVLAEADYDDAAAFEQTTAHIRGAIIEASMPAELAAEIADCYGSCRWTAMWRFGRRGPPRTWPARLSPDCTTPIWTSVAPRR